MIRQLVTVSVKRRVSVLMVSLAVMAFGAVGLSRLALNLLPDISYPSLTVQTEFPDTAPGEVENLVTKPVEEAVGVLKGLKEIHSVSRAGISEVTLEFGWDADMDMLSMDVREKLDRLVLPDETEPPIVLRYDPALDPIMRIALTGGDDLAMLRLVAEKQIKNELEKIQGVASAQLKGGEEEEIHVNINQGKVAAMGIAPADIASVLRSSNINRPGGSLKGDKTQYLVRTLNEYDSVQEIGELTITPRGRPPVKLADVADVSWGVKDREEITRVNGGECVVLDIFKEGGSNTVIVADAVKSALKSLEYQLPKGFSLSMLSDQSRFIARSIEEVRDALLIGGALAIIILFIFLRDTRATIVIATSIPISLVATFIFMYMLDVSMNIMSLGGLTLGIGMLVDSSIVVLESIQRYRQEGLTRLQAAIEGTAEVGGAVVASVLTTIAVFFPIVFVEGIAGQLFRDQALTVTFSLIASLIVSLSLIPMLTSLGSRGKIKKRAGVRMSDEKDETLGFLSRSYEFFLRGALRLRWTTVLLSVGILLACLRLVPFIGTELIPPLTEGEFFYEVALPEGTALPATDKVLKSMEERASAIPDVASVYATVGSRTVSGGLSLKNKDESLGQVNVVLKNRADDALEAEISRDLLVAFEAIPNVEIKLGRPSFFSLKTPIELLFYGEDLDSLREFTQQLKHRLAEIEGLDGVRTSMESGNPELAVVFDRKKLARMGLTIGDLSEVLLTRVRGTVVSQFKEPDRQIDIRLRNRESDRDSVSDIENAVITQQDGTPLPLKAVASVEPIRGPAEIHRIQQSRVAIISGEVSGRSLGAVVDDIVALVESQSIPRDITFEMGGQNKEMEASFTSLKFAILLAIFLVYLVMAATFENLIHPFIIMFTIPLALVGVILGLYLTGTTISVIAMLGVIFLVGVVVNNAIVLVDAINRGRRDGMEKLEAIVHAGKLRLRPILMTTLTTVLGLLPMAVGFGEGSELRTPLAIVVTAGLTVATLLTLVVIPAAYMIVPSTVTTYEEDEELERAIDEAGKLQEAAAGGV